MIPEQAGTKSYPSEGEDVIIFAVFRYEFPFPNHKNTTYCSDSLEWLGRQHNAN